MSTLPRVFGRYVLVASLGRGGMGEVFLAKHGALEGAERLCVVKTLRADLATNAEYLGRFLDEARIVVQLSHTGICHVFDAGHADDELYIAMEFIPGVNLRLVLSALSTSGGTIPPGIALHVASEVLDALAYAHRLRHRSTGEPLRVVHRDVSPHNVMVSFEGEVKLIDFGLAESDLKEEHTATQQVLGKVAYMSPEQARGDSVDAATDQFATAIMLYEMLAHDRFYGDMTTHQIWQIVGHGGFTPRAIDRVHPLIAPILMRALAPTPAERYASCDELRDALDDARTQLFPGVGRRDLRRLLHATFASKIADLERVVARASSVTLRGSEDESGSATAAAVQSPPLTVDMPSDHTRPAKSRAPTASEARAIDLAPARPVDGPPPPAFEARDVVIHTETMRSTSGPLSPGPSSLSLPSSLVDDAIVTPSTSAPLAGALLTDRESSASAPSASSPSVSSLSTLERTWQATESPPIADETSRVMRSKAPARSPVVPALIGVVALLALVVGWRFVTSRATVSDPPPSVVAVAPGMPVALPPVDAPPVDAPPVDAPPLDAPPVANEIEPPPVDAPPVDRTSAAAPDVDEPSEPRRGSRTGRGRRDRADRAKPEPVVVEQKPVEKEAEPKPVEQKPVEKEPEQKPVEKKPEAKPVEKPKKSMPSVEEQLAIVRTCRPASLKPIQAALDKKSASELTAQQVFLVERAARSCAPARFP